MRRQAGDAPPRDLNTTRDERDGAQRWQQYSYYGVRTGTRDRCRNVPPNTSKGRAALGVPTGPNFLRERGPLGFGTTLCEKKNGANPQISNEKVASPAMLAPRSREHVHPTPHFCCEAVLDLASVTSSDVMLDIGCGDARMLRLAARARGCRGEGWEICTERAREAQAAVAAEGLQALVTVREGNALTDHGGILGMTAPQSPFTVAFLYLNRRGLKRVLPYLRTKRHQFVLRPLRQN